MRYLIYSKVKLTKFSYANVSLILLCSSRLISLKYKHLAVLYASCFSLSTIIVLLKRYCYGHLHQLFINFKFLLPLDKSINLYFIVIYLHMLKGQECYSIFDDNGFKMCRYFISTCKWCL